MVARLVTGRTDAVQHGDGRLEHGRCAREHRPRGVDAAQGLDARVTAEVAVRGIEVRVVAPLCARRTGRVAQPVLVEPCRARRTLGFVLLRWRHRARKACHAQTLLTRETPAGHPVRDYYTNQGEIAAQIRGLVVFRGVLGDCETFTFRACTPCLLLKWGVVYYSMKYLPVAGGTRCWKGPQLVPVAPLPLIY